MLCEAADAGLGAVAWFALERETEEGDVLTTLGQEESSDLELL